MLVLIFLRRAQIYLNPDSYIFPKSTYYSLKSIQIEQIT